MRLSSFTSLVHNLNCSKIPAQIAASNRLPITNTESAISFSFKNLEKIGFHVREVTMNCLTSPLYDFRKHSSLIISLQISGCFSMMQSKFSNAMHFKRSVLMTCDDFAINSIKHGAVVTNMSHPLYNLTF